MQALWVGVACPPTRSPPPPPLPSLPQQDLVLQGEGLLPVLRLLLLYCAVHGGVPKRYYDNLRWVRGWVGVSGCEWWWWAGEAVGGQKGVEAKGGE